MKTDTLERINGLVTSVNIMDQTIATMDEQVESIKQYCIDAMTDCLETCQAVADLCTRHLSWFKVSETFTPDEETRIVEGYDNCLFHILLRPSGNHRVGKVHHRDSDHRLAVMAGGGKEGEALFLGTRFEIKTGARIIEELKASTPNLHEAMKMRKKADVTRAWVSQVLKLLEEHMLRIAYEKRHDIDEGYNAAAQKYKKVS